MESTEREVITVWVTKYPTREVFEFTGELTECGAVWAATGYYGRKDYERTRRDAELTRKIRLRRKISRMRI